VPSVMVLVLGDDSTLSIVADAVVAGAKRVRFTEVTTRAAKPDVFRYRQLDADATLGGYDGIVFVASHDASQDVSRDASGDTPAVRELERFAGAQVLANTVLASAGASDSAMRAALVALGGIVVSAALGSSLEEHAAAVGERVATVAGWVRHSLGHAAEAHHHHDDDHRPADHHHHHHGDDGHHHGGGDDDESRARHDHSHG
jgi:hypothetical protein